MEQHVRDAFGFGPHVRKDRPGRTYSDLEVKVSPGAKVDAERVARRLRASTSKECIVQPVAGEDGVYHVRVMDRCGGTTLCLQRLGWKGLGLTEKCVVLLALLAFLWCVWALVNRVMYPVTLADPVTAPEAPAEAYTVVEDPVAVNTDTVH